MTPPYPLPAKINGFRSRVINEMLDYLGAITPQNSITIRHEYRPDGVASEVLRGFDLYYHIFSATAACASIGTTAAACTLGTPDYLNDAAPTGDDLRVFSHTSGDTKIKIQREGKYLCLLTGRIGIDMATLLSHDNISIFHVSFGTKNDTIILSEAYNISSIMHLVPSPHSIGGVSYDHETFTDYTQQSGTLLWYTPVNLHWWLDRDNLTEDEFYVNVRVENHAGLAAATRTLSARLSIIGPFNNRIAYV